MPRMYLIRHGETDWNLSGQVMGEQPVPLNRTGETQARLLAGSLTADAFRTLVSSPVARAKQTAEILASVLRVPVTTDRGLTEINVGEWEGRYWKDLVDATARQSFYTSPHHARPPGGETLREVQIRAVAAVERARAGGGSGPLVFVSHADVLRAILAHYLNWDLQQVRQIQIAHASLTALELNATSAELIFLNYRPDLGGPG